MTTAAAQETVTLKLSDGELAERQVPAGRRYDYAAGYLAREAVAQAANLGRAWKHVELTRWIHRNDAGDGYEAEIHVADPIPPPTPSTRRAR